MDRITQGKVFRTNYFKKTARRESFAAFVSALAPIAASFADRRFPDMETRKNRRRSIDPRLRFPCSRPCLSTWLRRFGGDSEI